MELTPDGWQRFQKGIVLGHADRESFFMLTLYEDGGATIALSDDPSRTIYANISQLESLRDAINEALHTAEQLGWTDGWLT